MEFQINISEHLLRNPSLAKKLWIHFGNRNQLFV